MENVCEIIQGTVNKIKIVYNLIPQQYHSCDTKHKFVSILKLKL